MPLALDRVRWPREWPHALPSPGPIDETADIQEGPEPRRQRVIFPKHLPCVTCQPPWPDTLPRDPPDNPHRLAKALRLERSLSQLAESWLPGTIALDSGVSKNTGQRKTRSLEQRGPDARCVDGMALPEATGTSRRGDESLQAGSFPRQEFLIYHLRGKTE